MRRQLFVSSKHFTSYFYFFKVTQILTFLSHIKKVKSELKLSKKIQGHWQCFCKKKQSKFQLVEPDRPHCDIACQGHTANQVQCFYDFHSLRCSRTCYIPPLSEHVLEKECYASISMAALCKETENDGALNRLWHEIVKYQHVVAFGSSSSIYMYIHVRYKKDVYWMISSF